MTASSAVIGVLALFDFAFAAFAVAVFFAVGRVDFVGFLVFGVAIFLTC